MDQRQRQLVAKFVQETNLDRELAVDILAGTEWNYQTAVQVFNRMLKTNDRRLSFSSPPSKPTQAISNHKIIDDPPPKYERSPRQSPGSPEARPLHRGISYAHLKATKGGKTLKLPVTVVEKDEAKVDSHGYYFMLPDLRVLLQNSVKSSRKICHLNWWTSANTCSPLYTMTTSGDGNCLLHAATLSIWGMHDRELTLRSALNQVLTDEKFTIKMKKIQRRWKRQQMQVNQELGLEYTAAEWETEWDNVLKLSSTKPRHHRSPGKQLEEEEANSMSADVTYESLEEIHVFVLAHILLRPIIVVSDKLLRDQNGEPLAPNTFGGIYLPLESPPEKCCRSPIVLAYDASHFCALLPMNSTKKSIPNIIPITDAGNKILRVQFAVDPGLAWKFNDSKNIVAELTSEENLKLLDKYLDLVKIPSSSSSSKRLLGQDKVTVSDFKSPDFIIGVALSDKRHPEYENLIKDYVDSARRKSERSKAPAASSSSSSSSKDATDGSHPPSYGQAMQSLRGGGGGGTGASRVVANPSANQRSSNHTSTKGGQVTSPLNSGHAPNAPVYHNMTVGSQSSRSNPPRSPGTNKEPRSARTAGSSPQQYNAVSNPPRSPGTNKEPRMARTAGSSPPHYNAVSNPPRSPGTNKEPRSAHTAGSSPPHYNTVGSPGKRGPAKSATLGPSGNSNGPVQPLEVSFPEETFQCNAGIRTVPFMELRKHSFIVQNVIKVNLMEKKKN
ncbi:Otud7b protein [Apostichopus japonicus]|uniref:ubiquitinyl hydrolase 1 n=1 Tax=Stichopus japonicus TaxID=307972 RepID=A0A2G8KPV7_STIJA|nr:Otud7b protein [Apostichopus japonicus]